MLDQVKRIGLPPTICNQQPVNQSRTQIVCLSPGNKYEGKSSKKEKNILFTLFWVLSVSLVSILNFMLIRRLKKKLFSPYIRPKRDTGHGRKIAFEYDQYHFNMQEKGSALSGTGLIHDFKSIVATSLQHCQFKSMPKL